MADAAVVDAGALSDPGTFARGMPHELWARLRADRPVAWVPEVALARHGAGGTRSVRGSGYWAVTRHADVVAASRATDVFSSATRGVFLADPISPADLQRTRDLLINMDGDRHARMRRIVADAFTRRTVQQLEASVVAHAEHLVAGAVAAGGFEVVTDLAAELPLLVLAELLGIPAGDRARLREWTDALVGFDDPAQGGGDVDRFRRVFTEAFRYVMDLAADRLRHPGDDLVTRLVSGRVDGERLTASELCHFWLLLVVAGNDTTRNLVAGGIEALLDHPDQARRLAADPDLVPTAVEELLRWVTPIMQFRRTATTDTDLGGQAIAAGDKVVLYYASANRDAAVYRHPDTLDVGRTPNPHLAFGRGPHVCLGAQLARLEAGAVLRSLLPHLTRLERAGPTRRLASNFVNSVTELSVLVRS